MTTYDYSRDGRPAYASEKHYIIKRYIDFTAKAGVAADVWNLFDIPIYSFLQGMFCVRLTAAGAAHTVTISDSTPTAIETNLDINGTGYIILNDNVNLYYSAASVMSMTVNNSNTAAKFWLVAELFDLSDQANYAAYLA